jgi:thiamine biosynthesis protein ThiS
MNVYINGELQNIKENTTIEDIIIMLKLQNNPTAVELNGKFVEFSQYTKILCQNDRLFVRSFVGGG